MLDAFFANGPHFPAGRRSYCFHSSQCAPIFVTQLRAARAVVGRNTRSGGLPISSHLDEMGGADVLIGYSKTHYDAV